MKFLKQIFGLNSSKELKVIGKVKYIVSFSIENHRKQNF